MSAADHGQLLALSLVDDADALTEVGFDLDRPLGRTRLRVGDPDGTLSASLAGITALDGLALHSSRRFEALSGLEHAPGKLAGEPESTGGLHPNGAIAIDHVVIMTPNPDRTTLAFEAQDLPLRRVRHVESERGTRRQSFHWFGDVIAEVVGPDDGAGDDDARWWGLAVTVRDIAATARYLSGSATAVKPAVQPGRRVCTLRHPAIRTPILFISPHHRGVAPERLA